MDPSPFTRLSISNLALKSPLHSKPTRTAIHPSSSPCFCKIKLKKHASQNAVVPFLSDEKDTQPQQQQTTATTSFHLSKSDVDKLTGKSSIFPAAVNKKAQLRVYVYIGNKSGVNSCGLGNSGRLLGKIELDMDLSVGENKSVVFHNGWVSVGGNKKGLFKFQFHLIVKAEPDPRFVFGFDGDPVCSPQVSLIRGNVKQPVFTCKFSFRSSDRHQQRTRSLPSENSNGTKNWLSSFGSERERPGKERKGWSITIHDLSGSPVAAASMVTPFVASPGSDRVSRSNPGCWLILRPGDGTWKPWGRLEAWRERGSTEGLGYRFELIPELLDVGIVLSESTISCSKGGRFVVDLNGGNGTPRSACASPGVSPRSSGDFGYGLWPYCMYRGFVMSASVEGEGKGKGKTPPVVEVSVQHVNCTEDAAAFVALAAALDLSMDACRLFSQKLRKELCQPQELLC